MRLQLVIAAALLTLSACSTEGSGDRPDTPTTAVKATAAPHRDPADAVERAVRAYSKAFLGGDGATAYALLSKRCRAMVPLSEFAGFTEQAKQTYGDVDLKSMKTRVKGAAAWATYTYPVPAINQTNEKWVNESGRWHNDDC